MSDATSDGGPVPEGRARVTSSTVHLMSSGTDPPSADEVEGEDVGRSFGSLYRPPRDGLTLFTRPDEGGKGWRE